jgi:3-deoxy-D-manno-octulosonate 8-phosphate phosphatase (KDO 8-P phosphatase)
MTPNFERTHPISIEDLENRASSIRMLLLDVDGILTDGLLYLSNSGDEYKTFNTLDGQGIRIAI